MQYSTHVIFGFLLWLLLVKFDILGMTLFLFVVTSFVVIVASLLPDIDYPKSKIGKYFFYLNYGVTHRGFLHSFGGVLFSCIILFFVNTFISIPFAISLALIIGISSHLLLDSLTKSGIQPVYPLKWKIRGPFRTGKFGELLLRIVFFVLVLIAAIW